MNVGDRITLDVTSMAHGGEAVGRHESRVVFVRGALPDERVRVLVTDQRAKHWHAVTIEVLEASPDQPSPP